MKFLRDQLSQDGYLIFSNIGPEEVQTTLKALGVIILETDVRIVPSAKSLVQSPEPLEWHQDSPEARWIAWHCIETELQTSEPTELVDARGLDLSGHELDLLARSTISYRSIDDTLKKTKVWLEFPNRKQLYFCPWLLEEDTAKKLEWLKARIEAAKSMTHSWKRRDLVIIDNHRILHRRGPLNPDSKRHLKRYWIGDE